MGTINLSFHITGPDWAWLVIGAAAAILALSQAVNAGMEIWRFLLARKSVKDLLRR